MLKIKLQGLDSIVFNQTLYVKGEIPDYTIEHQDLEEKLCDASTIIYPTAEYEYDEDKFTAICTEMSCNHGTFVAFDSKDTLIEYFDVNGKLFTVKELFETFKADCTILYGCDHTGVKAKQNRLQDIVNCNSEYGCDFCMYKQGKYYAFDLDGNKVRLEDLGMEYHIYMTTPDLMKEVEKIEAEW